MNLGHGVGPIPTRIMVVGEAWGQHEDDAKEPFVGPSGAELNRMLHEAGILRSECFVTNLANARPAGNDIGLWMAKSKKEVTSAHVPLHDKMVLPIIKQGYEQLRTEVLACQPNVIIAFGNTAMWALTGEWGILKWRGSLLESRFDFALPGGNADGSFRRPKVIPCIHPAAILREFKLRGLTVSDLRRAAKQMQFPELHKPKWNFITQPSFKQVQETLTSLLTPLENGETLWLDFDLETRLGHISCVGISWTRQDAICIPFMYSRNREGYWTLEEEAWIVYMLQRVCCHTNARVRWQNGLYDAQYTYRHWHFIPRGAQDTMISQHSVFSDLPKALSFIASMYCDYYRYWKDEGKDFNTGGRDEAQGWVYNCEDCVYTRESGEVLQDVIDLWRREWEEAQREEDPEKRKRGWERGPEVHRFQNALFYPVLRAMLKGVRIVESNKKEMSRQIKEQVVARETFITTVLGHPINIDSPKQMQALFYKDLGQPVIMTRAKKGKPAHVTCDDGALQKIASREPLLKPLVNAMADIRTLDKLLGVVESKLDQDGRMRCSYNIGGSSKGKSAPKTYRLSSSKSAYDSGGNLQNISSEKSKAVGKYSARGHVAMFGDPYALPNVRSIFGPDPGNTFWDMDLDRADLQVMAWDADEELLKAVCRLGADVHLLNVYILDNHEPPPLEELVEGHPKYPDHRGPRKLKREFSKVFCHATDYLGKSRTVAAATGRTIHEIERAQKTYLGRYKGIETWQQNIIDQVKKQRYIENKFGYRWYIFDRIDDQVMPEAVAWIPQSTVSIVINKIWMNLFQNAPEGDWNLDPDYLWKLLLETKKELEVLLQVHDSLGGQFVTSQKERMLRRIKELSSIVIPYDDPLIIPVGIQTSELSWGECK